MINISPLCPMNFTDAQDSHSGELERMYIQQFVKGDSINFQLYGGKGKSVIATVSSHSDSRNYSAQELVINSDISVYNITVSTDELKDGEIYSVQIVSHDSVDGYAYFNSINKFEVVQSCERLKLIEYYDTQNITAFSTYFNLGGIQTKFSFRVPAGFKSNSYSENISSETFRNQNQEIQHLYSFPYRSKTLIIGDGMGIPSWMAKLINYVFCLSNVYVDGERLSRSDDSVPERQESMEGYPFHIYNLTVEESSNLRMAAPSKVEKGDFGDDFNNDFKI